MRHATAEDLIIAVGTERTRARLHRAAAPVAGMVWVFGSGGGFGGPAGGLYERLAVQLQPEGITSLQLDYRSPGVLRTCVVDVLAGVAFLDALGPEPVLLAGHSFGGAVVIAAAVKSARVGAVAALSSQCEGTENVPRLSPRPLLLMHGEEDEILPAACSADIYRRARQPKLLLLYPGCRHGLDECRESVYHDLLVWIRRVVAGEAVARWKP